MLNNIRKGKTVFSDSDFGGCSELGEGVPLPTISVFEWSHLQSWNQVGYVSNLGSGFKSLYVFGKSP